MQPILAGTLERAPRPRSPRSAWGRRSSSACCSPGCSSAGSSSTAGSPPRPTRRCSPTWPRPDASAIVDELNAEGVALPLADGGQTIMVRQGPGLQPAADHERQGPAGRPGHRVRAARPAGHHHQPVPAAGHLPAGHRGRAGQDARGDQGRQHRGRAPRDAQGRRSSSTDQGKPTASVLLDLARRHQAHRRAGPGGHQPGLLQHRRAWTPTGVTVADSTGQVLVRARQRPHRGRRRRPLARWSRTYESRLAANAQQILDTRRRPQPRAGVRPRRPSTSTRSSRRRRPTPTRNGHARRSPQSTTSEKYTGNGDAGRRRPRPLERHRRPQPAAAGRTTTRRRRTQQQRRRTRRRRRRRPPPGDIKRLTVSVVLDSAVAGNLNQSRSRAWSATPSAWTPPAATPSPSRRCRSTPRAAKQAAADLAAAKAADASAQMWSMIKTGGIAAGILLVILAGLAALAPPRRDRGGVRAARAHRRHARRARPAADRQHPRGAAKLRPRSTTRQLELEAAERPEGPRGHLHDGQREARRGGRHAPRLAERGQVMTIATVEQLVGLGGAGAPGRPAPPARARSCPGLRKAAVFLAQMTQGGGRRPAVASCARARSSR